MVKMAKDDDGDRPAGREEVLFDIEMALAGNARLWPVRRVPGGHNPHRWMAAAVLEHLELCGLRFRRRSPGERHRTPPPGGGTGRP